MYLTRRDMTLSVAAVSYCLNPNCPNPSDPLNVNESICRNCGSSLLLMGDRYRIVRFLGSGHFGRTFEVDDRGTPKIIKVLKLQGFNGTIRKQKVESLFKREAEVLICLNHPGIPKVEEDGYFVFWPIKSQEPLHCLVMEKIDGVNLYDWLKSRGNRPITQAEALDWLKQLAEILHQVHKQQYCHRDIKPSNCMIRPNGQLALIDFGAVKELGQTYLSQQNASTVIGTRGYAPPEQMRGESVQQSDFFALGRTFVHLLTGKHPQNLEDPKTGKLIWRNSVPHISKSWGNFLEKLIGRSLLDFIDELIEPSWKKRPKNTQEILKRLKQIGRHPLIELAAGAAVILAVGAAGINWYLTGVNGCSKIWLRSFPVGDNLSCGEEILVPDLTVPEKQEGVDAFAADNYKNAVSLLEKAWQKQHDPETLIYLNNARLIAEKAPAYTIAVAAPVNGKTVDTGLEMLRGVAQAQDDYNRTRKPSQPGLKVAIANDGNQRAQAKKIASALVSKGDVLAVVGHYASEITLEGLEVYPQHKLLLISPTSTSEDLSNKSPFFFRISPSDRISAQAFVIYLITQVQQRKVALFYNPNSNFSKSIRDEFHSSFGASGGQVLEEFDLSAPSFIANVAIDKAQKQGATALVLLPDGHTSGKAISNALNTIRANRSRYLLVGASSLYGPEILELVGPEAASHLAIAIPWHRLNSPNPEFPIAAKNLWGGDVNWRTALSYDAARVLITALEQLPKPDRISVEKALAEPTFRASGATGEISFRTNRDRKESISTLVKVVPSKCSSFGYMFVPINYSPEKVEELDRTCKKEK